MGGATRGELRRSDPENSIEKIRALRADRGIARPRCSFVSWCRTNWLRTRYECPETQEAQGLDRVNRSGPESPKDDRNSGVDQQLQLTVEPEAVIEMLNLVLIL